MLFALVLGALISFVSTAQANHASRCATFGYVLRDHECVPACKLGVTWLLKTGDITCAPVRTCILGRTYEFAAPTITSDRVCEEVAPICRRDEYEDSPATLWSNRVCKKLTKCVLGESFELQAPTHSTDRVCLSVNPPCSPTGLFPSFESQAPTLFQDRICSPYTLCFSIFGFGTYESKPPTDTSDRKCSPITACAPNQYLFKEYTATSNNVCLYYSTCKEGQYELVAPTWNSNRVCQAVTDCQDHQYEVMPATSTTDRICWNHRVCGANGRPEYEVARPTRTTDRQCAPTTECVAGSFIAKAATADADNVCAPWSPKCVTGSFESVAPSQWKDRTCRFATICASALLYESAPPTYTSDRVCAKVSNCPANQIERFAPTQFSDRICVPKPTFTGDLINKDAAIANSYARIAGSLEFANQNFITLTVSVDFVDGFLSISDNNDVTGIHLAFLQRVGRDFSVYSNPSLQVLSVPVLTTVGGRFYICNNNNYFVVPARLPEIWGSNYCSVGNGDAKCLTPGPCRNIAST